MLLFLVRALLSLMGRCFTSSLFGLNFLRCDVPLGVSLLRLGSTFLSKVVSATHGLNRVLRLSLHLFHSTLRIPQHPSHRLRAQSRFESLIDNLLLTVDGYSFSWSASFQTCIFPVEP
jgi:hypothetical protein